MSLCIWHRSLHLVIHPGLQSTPLNARRGQDGSMSGANLAKIVTRVLTYGQQCVRMLLFGQNQDPPHPWLCSSLIML